MPSQTPLRIFLCHSSGDKPAVRQLHRRLKESGYEPWLDEEDLLPGQRWQREIPRAVRNADVVLVCLSEQAVSKQGYVQKEISFALDAAEERPEGTVFLIPVRLSECMVPERLAEWQWVDLFDERGYERLLRSLHSVTPPAPASVSPASVAVAKADPQPSQKTKSPRPAPSLFPLYGVTLGKTTAEELSRLGTRSSQAAPDSGQPYPYYKIKDTNFWYMKGNVADVLYIARGIHPIPEEWAKLGFNWEKSYAQWCETLRSLDFSVTEEKEPQIVDYLKQKSLSGRVSGRRLGETPVAITLSFDYNRGTSVDSPGVLYSIKVESLNESG